MISEMSKNDLKTLGHSGLCNNRPFSSASEYQTAAAGAATLNNIANPAIQHK